MPKLTAYQKRIQERDTARREINRLRELIYDNTTKGTRSLEMHEVATVWQCEKEVEALAWHGDATQTKTKFDGINALP